MSIFNSSKLSKDDREFLNRYFDKTNSIWTEYFDGYHTMKMFRMSQNKREIELNCLRDRLHQILRKL
jgi:hypothetical protein